MFMKKKKNGFTLIELMVVIVIIGILVAIALPNFIAANNRAKISSVKSNMHVYQVLLETYGIDNVGKYPNSATQLANEAILKGYDKQYKNPFTGVNLTLSGPDLLAEVVTGSSVPNSWSGVNAYSGGSAFAGQVIYRRSLPVENYARYTLYGLDKDANFILDKNIVFVLSND